MDNLDIIAKILDYDSTILYNFLCVNKYTSIELLNNITFLCLPNNNELIDDNLKNIEAWRKGGGLGIHHTSIFKTIKELRGLIHD